MEAGSLGGELTDWAAQAATCAAHAESILAAVGEDVSGPVIDYVLAQAAGEVSYYRAVSAAAGTPDAMKERGLPLLHRIRSPAGRVVCLFPFALGGLFDHGMLGRLERASRGRGVSLSDERGLRGHGH